MNKKCAVEAPSVSLAVINCNLVPRALDETGSIEYCAVMIFFTFQFVWMFSE